MCVFKKGQSKFLNVNSKLFLNSNIFGYASSSNLSDSLKSITVCSNMHKIQIDGNVLSLDYPSGTYPPPGGTLGFLPDYDFIDRCSGLHRFAYIS